MPACRQEKRWLNRLLRYFWSWSVTVLSGCESPLPGEGADSRPERQIRALSAVQVNLNLCGSGDECWPRCGASNVVWKLHNSLLNENRHM